MRKYLYAASAALAAVAMSPAANASVTITCPAVSGQGVCTFDEAVGAGLFGDTFSTAQSFTDTFDIVLTKDYLLSITAAKTAGAGGDISFSLAALFDSASNLLGPISFDAGVSSFLLGPGTYTLKVSGSAEAKSAYSGNIGVVAVPEPAAWSLMIVGLTVLGAALRRRHQVASVSFS